jgi:hypothetical protein
VDIFQILTQGRSIPFLLQSKILVPNGYLNTALGIILSFLVVQNNSGALSTEGVLVSVKDSDERLNYLILVLRSREHRERRLHGGSGTLVCAH